MYTLAFIISAHFDGTIKWNGIFQSILRNQNAELHMIKFSDRVVIDDVGKAMV